jgi:serine/threonine protein kinase
MEKEGKGQAINYMASVISMRATNGEFGKVYGIFTNITSITFYLFLVTETGTDIFESPSYSFLPRTKPTEPTPGFDYFMRLFNSSSINLGCHAPLQEIEVGPRTKIRVITRIAAGGNSQVYECTHHGASIAVKIAPGIPDYKWRARIREEYIALKLLAKQNAESDMGFPRLVQDLQHQAEFYSLCTTPVGHPLRTLLPIDLAFNIHLLREVFKVLKLAKHANLCHGDIHPSNIIVIGKGHVVLIDWELAVPPYTVRSRFTGMPHYQPTSLLTAACSEHINSGLHYIVTHQHDIESCAYLFLYLRLDGNLPWAACTTLEDIIAARKNFHHKSPIYAALLRLSVCFFSPIPMMILISPPKQTTDNDAAIFDKAIDCLVFALFFFFFLSFLNFF